MKHRKTFITVCCTVIVITLLLMALVVLDIVKVMHFPNTVLFIILFVLFIMLILSFACLCILQTLYDDWKARRVGRNERWHK